MSWSIVPLPTEGPLFDQAIAVYAEAFARPPYRDNDRGRDVRQRMQTQHRRYPAFRAFCAQHSSNGVAGMIYGYHGERGQWWHDNVSVGIGPALHRDWLADSYEVCEVAVSPAYQSFGIGRALVNRLLEGCTEATSVLTTRVDSRAHVLYERLGFEVVHTMRFFSDGFEFYVMGKRLRIDTVVA